MKKLLIIALSISISPFSTSDARDTLFVWFGGEFQGNNWKDTTFAGVDEWIDMPVYFSGNSINVVVADMCLPLGINKSYLDQFNADSCLARGPAALWDLWDFTNLNDEFQSNWASLSFLGWAECAGQLDWNCIRANPDSAILGLSFRIHTIADTNMYDQTICNALGPGIDPVQGTANAGDSLGTSVGFEVVQNFACITFRHPGPVPTLNEWGMLILALILLAAGTVAVVRRRAVTEKT